MGGDPSQPIFHLLALGSLLVHRWSRWVNWGLRWALKRKSASGLALQLNMGLRILSGRHVQKHVLEIMWVFFVVFYLI